MLRRRSVAIELRLRADAEAKKAAKARLKSIMLRFTTGTLAGKKLLISVIELLETSIIAIMLVFS